MQVPKILFALYGAAVAFAVVGTLVSALTGVNPGLIAPIAAFVMLALGAATTALSIGKIWPVLGAAMVCASIEMIGVKTGFPFGRYSYTESWQPVIGIGGGDKFPLQIVLAWLMVGGASWLVAARFTSGAGQVALSGLIAMFVDIPMEDVMTHRLGYWVWQTPGPIFGAPLQNSTGWLFCACASSLVLTPGRVPRDVKYAPFVLGGFCILMGETALLAHSSSTLLWIAYAIVLVGIGFWPPKARSAAT